MTETVGIVIVSHSSDIAKGTADMVRQMVGSEVKVAFCGGNPDGGLGTSVPLIIDAINAAWSPKGVAVLVDLAGQAADGAGVAVQLVHLQQAEVVEAQQLHGGGVVGANAVGDVVHDVGDAHQVAFQLPAVHGCGHPRLLPEL
ncbi:MAG: PTS mannose transporter subunit IID [Bradyrhizobium sp. PARBB1]|nr:MAG: PTS mannose transporter subunit IID [Bradyrhizobium sp. PARBB1]